MAFDGVNPGQFPHVTGFFGTPKAVIAQPLVSQIDVSVGLALVWFSWWPVLGEKSLCPLDKHILIV
jgi:hypothetical protein